MDFTTKLMDVAERFCQCGLAMTVIAGAYGFIRSEPVTIESFLLGTSGMWAVREAALWIIDKYLLEMYYRSAANYRALMLIMETAQFSGVMAHRTDLEGNELCLDMLSRLDDEKLGLDQMDKVYKSKDLDAMIEVNDQLKKKFKSLHKKISNLHGVTEDAEL